MLVLVNGNVYDSDKTPVMIMFSREEMTSFKNQPDHVDIHCSFPRSWGQVTGRKWMNDNKSMLIKSKGFPTKTLSDDEIKGLVGKKDDEEESSQFGEFFFTDDKVSEEKDKAN